MNANPFASLLPMFEATNREPSSRQTAVMAIMIAILGSLSPLRAQDHTSLLKPRVIVTTDINNGSGDPDDRQSLCHLLWYANELDIRAIIPDRFSESAVQACDLAFDHYQRDFENTTSRFRELGFPNPDDFRNKILVRSQTKAVERIIAEANASDRHDPVWILVWGNMNLLGEALKTDPTIAPRLRVITIGTFLKAKESGGDGYERNWNGAGRKYVFDNFPHLWWIESDWTYNGMFPGVQPVRLKESLATFGGELGKHIRDVIATVPWADNFRAGDTPTVLYMVDPSHNLDDPSTSSWAGRYVNPFPQVRSNYWIGITGGHKWDFTDPTKTWANASDVYQARANTLAKRRPEMYESLLARVKELYQSENLVPATDALERLPSFRPEAGLQLEAELADKSSSASHLAKDENASAGKCVSISKRGWIVFRFQFSGSPAKYKATLRCQTTSNTAMEELFVNSANLGKVSFSNAGQENWQTKAFDVFLEDGPNSVVIRGVEGEFLLDAITITHDGPAAQKSWENKTKE